MLAFDPIAEARRQWEAHGWHDASLGMAAVTSIIRAEQIFLTRIERLLRPLGLSFARYEALRLLGFSRAGELPLGKMGERLQVRAGSITNAVDRLEADGLVNRRSSDDDGRVVLAAITDDGRVLLERATKELNEVFAETGLSDVELGVLVATIATLRSHNRDFGGDQ